MESSFYEEEARGRWRKNEPSAVYEELIAENDALIRQPELDNGREIVEARTAIHTVPVEVWAREQQEEAGYDKPFAVVALGGTGRREMTPCSDTDFAFLFDEAIEDNKFLLELQRQVLHTSEFRDRYGFDCEALPFGLDDVPSISGKQLNAFLDMRPLHDPGGLSTVFRERIRTTFDPFEHFLHVQRCWKREWEPAIAASESLENFDIKNAGLRLFLGGIWTLAGKNFDHSRDIYGTLEDSRDLDAYYFLLRIRTWVHLRQRGARSRAPAARGNHPEDIMGFDAFTSFGEMLDAECSERDRFEFDNEVRARLLSARRRVAAFAQAVIESELHRGRAMAPGSPIVYGTGGLFHAASNRLTGDCDKSRAALSLLLASKRYGVRIDPSELLATFRGAGEWLVRVPEVSALFYERRGSLADTFEFLSQLDGAEDRLFPGYGRFEASLDERVMTERKTLRSKLERQKLRNLEKFVARGEAALAAVGSDEKRTKIKKLPKRAISAALLDADHLAAVYLALKTKRLPLTDEDLAMRADESLRLHERFASGISEIPLAEYYRRIGGDCDFTEETLAATEFLVAHRRAFKERSDEALNDIRQVREFAELCQNEQRLRALFVFTCADRHDWENDEEDPARWFNSRELFSKALQHFRPESDATRSLTEDGYTSGELEILKNFGAEFFSGAYRHHANRFGSHLLRLADDPNAGPKAALVRDGTATMIGVAARDYRGLATSITGALWKNGIQLLQAHLFSADKHGLALDFFHVTRAESPIPRELPRIVEQAIREQRHIDDTDGNDDGLPDLNGTLTLVETRPGHCRLRFETVRDAPGSVYALTSKIYQLLQANIYGLTTQVARGGKVYILIYLNLPKGVSPANAETLLAQKKS